MRIAYVVHKFPPESLGGTEIYTWSLARTVAEAGHEAYVFYPLANLPPSRDRAPRDGIRLWQVPLSLERITEGPARQFWHTFRDAAIEASFRDFLSQVQPEVVHYQHVQGVSARLIHLAAGRPRLVTLHDYWFFCANSQLVKPTRQVCPGPQGGWSCVDCAAARSDLAWVRALRPLAALPFRYRNWYLRRALAQADLLIAPSNFLRQQYVRRGFSPERITVLENGLDMKRLTTTPAMELLPPQARPHFGYLGSLAWQKGVHVLVEAFNQVPESAALTIYGSDKAFPDYAAQVKAKVRHPHVRFAGRLDHRHVGAALRQLDCVVVPSLWYENSPVVIQEAFGMGVPVVASRLGALPEKVRDGETGRLFAPGDSHDLARVLREIIERPEQLEALRANIRPAPSMEEHANVLLEMYRSLVVGQNGFIG